MKRQTIADAIHGAPRAEPSIDWRTKLVRTSDGAIRKNLHNACAALRGHPALAGKIAYDEFRGCTHVRGRLPWDDEVDRPWTEFDDLKATEWLQSADVGVMVASSIAREAVQLVAWENGFHAVLQWLETLKWDGKERLSGWLSTYFGVARTPLSDAIGRKFLISAVARVMQPGCKVDHVLILEGLQGTNKSKSLRALVGDAWFTDQIADLGTKDSSQDLRGVWVIELSELSAIRPGEVERVKAYVTRQVDHYRPSYGRRSIDVPRQCVFIGTTNAREYLSDITGNRRYWPVTCTKLDLEAIAQDREQLWAEAVVAYQAGESWWLEDEELRRAAEAEQEARRIADPWEAIIAAWLGEPTTTDQKGIRVPFALNGAEVAVAAVLEHAIAKPVERQTTVDQMRVGKILAKLGWKKRKSHGRMVWAPGIPGSQVSPEASSGETSGESRSQSVRDPGDTFRTHVHSREIESLGTRGPQVSPTANGSPQTRRNGQLRAGLISGAPLCAFCQEPIETDAGGYTATGGGEYLHNGCVER